MPAIHPHRRVPAFLAASLALTAACGGGDGEEGYPSRNWSGAYAVRVVGSSTDCAGAEAPPPMSGFLMRLVHHTTNRVEVEMNPIVTLEGAFEGDRMTAGHAVEEPVSLPDSLLERATPTDSIETIRYALTADFEGDGFEGRYEIRAPDLRALVEGRPARCSYRYRLAGTFFGEGVTAPAGRPATEAPAEPRSANPSAADRTD